MLVEFNNVSKIYNGDIVALKDVTFSLDPGEFTFIVGSSGAGKSTIIRLLIRQEMPSTGDIRFGEIDVPKIPRPLLSLYRQQLGIVFQDLKLIDTKTIRENIEFALEIINKPKNEVKDTTDYLLETVKLHDKGKLFPVQLSGGEKQRVAIARALANDPKLLIADEPTGNLDPKTSEEILEILKNINNWGTTVMVVTHDKDIVNLLRTRVIHMENGMINSDRPGGYDYDDDDTSRDSKKVETKDKNVDESKESDKKDKKDKSDKDK